MKAKQICSVILALLLALSALTIAPAAAEGWDGKTATAPAGSGTQDDPYLVSSAANLLWMSQNIKKGDTVSDTAAGDDYGPSFADAWFEQTCDIDLNGKSLRSIGYYHANDKRMAAFGGNYDGNGYSIFNGSIVSYNTGHALNVNWGHGLFGTIYGATIQNVVLEGLAISGHGVTGGIVGRAVASAGAAADETFNVVENCVVSGCTVTAGYVAGKINASDKGKYFPGGYMDTAGRLGGVVGMAYGTTVKNCISSAVLKPVGGYNMVGGIAGSAGFGVIVDHCAFTGRIEASNVYTEGDATFTTVSETAYGGIVGFISPFSGGTQDKNATGKVQITNCYNSGVFRFLGENGTKTATYWGGILGGINALNPIAATEDEPYPYLMENCYNLYAETSEESLKGKPDNFRIGGLLGSAWCSAGANVGTLYIKDSSSVDVEERHYTGTNEYRHQINKTSAGLYPVEPVMNGEQTTVTTKTADEILVLTAGIDEAIGSALESAIEIKAYQASKTSEDGRMSFRFLYAVESLDWSKIGIEVSMNGATLTEEGTTVYTSVLGYNPETGEDETYTAESLGASYLAALTLNNIPTTGTYTFEVKAYAVESFGETEIKNYGTVCTVTVTDGQLTIQ